MPAPPALSEISAPFPNPSNATARLGFAKLWNYVTGLLGLTGNAAEARAALGMGTGVVLLRTSVYTRAGGVQYVSTDGGTPTTTGATSFTKQAATSFVEAEGVGGGGGSGGNPATSASQQAFSAGGGGGAFGVGRYTGALTGVTVTVGLGGTAGAAGGAGGAGGTTSFGSMLTVPGGPGSPAGVPTGAVGSVGGALGGALPTGANLVARAGGASLQVLSANLGFVSPQTAGASGDGPTNSYGVGAPGKYNGVSTATPQAGIAAPFDGRLVVKEYA